MPSLDELTPMQWASWNGYQDGHARWQEVVSLRQRRELEKLNRKG